MAIIVQLEPFYDILDIFFPRHLYIGVLSSRSGGAVAGVMPASEKKRMLLEKVDRLC
jgi:hypothetical protein